MGLDILSKLGEELPRSFSDEYIELQIKTTQTMLDKISLTDLLTYKMMTNKKKMMAMKFLRRLKEVTEQVNPNLLVSDKCLRLVSFIFSICVRLTLQLFASLSLLLK
jgi:hypothetical protein